MTLLELLKSDLKKYQQELRSKIGRLEHEMECTGAGDGQDLAARVSSATVTVEISPVDALAQGRDEAAHAVCDYLHARMAEGWQQISLDEILPDGRTIQQALEVACRK